MSWNGETNPHFWPRDRPQAPSQAPGDIPGPARQQPGKKLRPRERPAHIRLPPVDPVVSQPRPPRERPLPSHPRERPDRVRPPLPIIEPVVSQPTPRPRQPKYDDPTQGSYHPQVDLPTSQDHWPLHPHEASQDHWPLHPYMDNQEQLPHHHVEPTMVRPPRKQGPPVVSQPSHGPHGAPLHPYMDNQEQPPPPHLGPTMVRPPRKQGSPVVPPPKQGLPVLQPDHGPHVDRPPRRQGLPGDHRRRPTKDQDLIYPTPNRTNPCTWFIAVLCIILWVAIILGAILVLIIYLAYRPRNPHFEISDASLNAAYLDMGYLLNADLTLLVNFTNPNRKMSVDFNFIVLKLSYESHLIANQYIEPFSAGKLEPKFARVEMVSSQIRLPVLVTQQLVKQIQGNRVSFELDGYFHARSRLGSIFRYSYWLYSHCTIVTTGPPSGIKVSSKCTTKR